MSSVRDFIEHGAIAEKCHLAIMEFEGSSAAMKLLIVMGHTESDIWKVRTIQTIGNFNVGVSHVELYRTCIQSPAIGWTDHLDVFF